MTTQVVHLLRTANVWCIFLSWSITPPNLTLAFPLAWSLYFYLISYGKEVQFAKSWIPKCVCFRKASHFLSCEGGFVSHALWDHANSEEQPNLRRLPLQPLVKTSTDWIYSWGGCDEIAKVGLCVQPLKASPPAPAQLEDKILIIYVAFSWNWTQR